MSTSEQQSSYHEKAKLDQKTELRKLVSLILPDELMVVLAVITIALVWVPLITDLPESITASFRFADQTILVVFIVEYLLKTILASNVLKHILDPWHLIDLFIVLAPFISSSPMMHLSRVIRIAAVGGRALHRKIKLDSLDSKPNAQEEKHMELRVIQGSLDNIQEGVSFSNLNTYLNTPAQNWLDISSVSEADFDRLSDTLGVPKILLESRLSDESYPQVDYFEHYSLIFARVTSGEMSSEDSTQPSANRSDLLVVCHGNDIITISKTRTSMFRQILERAKRIHSPGEPLAVSILYTILKYLIEKDKQIVAGVEKELINFENTPLNERQANFLETTFSLRKEINQLVPALLHLKEIISEITSKSVPLEGFSDRHEKKFEILMDEVSYVYETASSARDSLIYLVDLYMNTMSYETNKVMRTIAVITSLGIIPAIFGLLGSNIVGNPWGIELWQVFTVLGVLMLTMSWIFYRMGWFKG
jgi:Mg2+ and Co2+ transporter CorA